MAELISNLPPRWDLQADFVSVGSGAGGLAAAITAHDHGASAMVLERTDQLGGVTAYSLGEVGAWQSPGSGARDRRLA